MDYLAEFDVDLFHFVYNKYIKSYKNLIKIENLKFTNTALSSRIVKNFMSNKVIMDRIIRPLENIKSLFTSSIMAPNKFDDEKASCIKKFEWDLMNIGPLIRLNFTK